MATVVYRYFSFWKRRHLILSPFDLFNLLGRKWKSSCVSLIFKSRGARESWEHFWVCVYIDRGNRVACVYCRRECWEVIERWSGWRARWRRWDKARRFWTWTPNPPSVAASRTCTVRIKPPRTCLSPPGLSLLPGLTLSVFELFHDPFQFFMF